MSFTKYLTFLMMAFSFISSVVQLVALRQVWPIVVTLVCTSLSALFFALYARRSQYEIAARELDYELRRGGAELPDAKLETARSEAQLKEIYGLNQEIYGEHNVSYETFKKWWESYRDGLYILHRDSEIIGYLSIWPLKEGAFKKIVEGERRAKDLAPQSINGKTSDPRVYWFISNIVVRREFRGALALIERAFNKWQEEAKLAERIKVCALACNRKSEVMLKKFGFSRFQEAHETRDGFPLYLFDGPRQDLTACVLSRLNRLRKRAGAGRPDAGLSPEVG